MKLDIPIGKALIAVKAEGYVTCAECAMDDTSCIFLCSSFDRADKKDVIYKLVDWPKGSE
jgi:hypothetical protein